MTRALIKKLILVVGVLLAINLFGLVYFSQPRTFRPFPDQISENSAKSWQNERKVRGQQDLKIPEPENKAVISNKIQSETKKDFLKVVFLDVGQGDAILIQTPQKKNILIDGGPDRQIIYKLDQYISITNRKIDFLILTHPDPDHLNGLVEVLKRYEVNQVIFTNVDDPDPAYSEFKKIIQEKNIPQKIIKGPEKIFLSSRNLNNSNSDSPQPPVERLDQIAEPRRPSLFEKGAAQGEIVPSEARPIWENKVYLDISHPLESLAGKSFKNDNLTSIVSQLSFGKTLFLFTGDATKEVEEKIIKANVDLKSDVLKVSHHGSKDATSEEFLEKIKPTYAVIPVGKNNKYGHPHLRVLKNLEKIQAEVYRTDEDGDIIFKSDGENLEIKTFK